MQGLAEDGGDMLTDDDIIRMAREAGWEMGDDLTDGFGVRLARFASLVAAAERESNTNAVRRALLSIDGAHGVTHGVWHIAQRVVDHCVRAIEERA
jgi:hypothetical protein